MLYPHFFMETGFDESVFLSLKPHESNNNCRIAPYFPSPRTRSLNFLTAKKFKSQLYILLKTPKRYFCVKSIETAQVLI